MMVILFLKIIFRYSKETLDKWNLLQFIWARIISEPGSTENRERFSELNPPTCLDNVYKQQQKGSESPKQLDWL